MFDKHAQEGTRFLFATAQQFLQKGWGKQYAGLVRNKWKGRSHTGISHTLQGLPKHTYRVGQRFDCVAVLSNDGETPQRLNTGGSCGMTHALGLLVIPPDGGLGVGWCTGLGGGPHGRCRSNYQSVDPGKSIKLATGFASDAAIEWKPDKPGDYLVIGTYYLQTKGAQPIVQPKRSDPSVLFSAPLAITVEG